MYIVNDIQDGETNKPKYIAISIGFQVTRCVNPRVLEFNWVITIYISIYSRCCTYPHKYYRMIKHKTKNVG